MSNELLVLSLLALPIAGFALTAIFGRRLGANSWAISVGAIILTWLAGMALVIGQLTGGFGPD
ncbi:MAG: hypothetical protein KGK07_17280, partial [Chloroflexota bacterium]|nr:hypothetical protein [Chloroflexota bacterium]